MASPSRGATVRMVILGICRSGGRGTVSVIMSLSTGAFWILSTAPSHNTPCVAARKICLAPPACIISAAPQIDPAVLIMSSKIQTTLPSTLPPITWACLVFSGAAAAFVDDCQVPADPRDVDHRPFYAALVRADDHEIILKSHGLDVIVDYRRRNRWSMGISKKPWIWAVCRSMATTRPAPRG